MADRRRRQFLICPGVRADRDRVAPQKGAVLSPVRSAAESIPIELRRQVALRTRTQSSEFTETR